MRVTGNTMPALPAMLRAEADVFAVLPALETGALILGAVEATTAGVVGACETAGFDAARFVGVAADLPRAGDGDGAGTIGAVHTLGTGADLSKSPVGTREAV